MGGSAYINVNTPVGALAAGKHTFSAKITNNGEATLTLRVDLNGEVQVNNTNAANVSATMDGVEVYTDTTWGGSKFEIAAGATVSVKVEYDSARNVDTLMFFIDSAIGDSEVRSGSVRIAEMAFTGAKAEQGSGEQPENPDEPEQPAEEYLTIAFANDPYVVTPASGTEQTISYVDIGATSYANVYTYVAPELSEGKTTLTFKITDNKEGGNATQIRIDLLAGEGKANVSVSTENGSVCWNSDGEGSFVQIAAGVTDVVTITFEGSFDGILLFIDTTVWGAADTYSGSITIGNFVLS